MAQKQKGGKEGAPQGPRCLRGEPSGRVIEGIEPDESLGRALLMRTREIPNYELYGPPDMCYLVKEKKTGLMSSKVERAGYFHYVFGVDLSSTASPSAYIKSVMGLAGQDSGDTPTTKKKSKMAVKSATFCTFDIVTRRDIRVEI